MTQFNTNCSVTIGPILRKDWPFLSEVELSAAQLFKDSPYPELASSAACTGDAVEQHFATGGLGWSAKTAEGALAGFIIAHRVGASDLHIDELSVGADYQGQGIGTSLLDHCIKEAKPQSFDALFLTTYSDIAWNGPFYARHGFEIIPTETQPYWLRDIVSREIAAGANTQSRIAMRLDL
ncbi:MAG TPA: N-acetyltransferase [Rhizobiales bacterium]|uniref:Ribosomal protein S18 acetylase RimI n=1 Tax=Cohaesibacter gelatinilyticus TaxID=372072 RepID=A0A285PDW1_9HYPH|nr:Ribosomal protein S18 acetylase RimI [Cohaesibacter gelatinilyticus]HAT87343.1 N-acetyltransferase [Hyphomicrobiales bacterium]